MNLKLDTDKFNNEELLLLTDLSTFFSEQFIAEAKNRGIYDEETEKNKPLIKVEDLIKNVFGEDTDVRKVEISDGKWCYVINDTHGVPWNVVRFVDEKREGTVYFPTGGSTTTTSPRALWCALERVCAELGMGGNKSVLETTNT